MGRFNADMFTTIVYLFLTPCQFLDADALLYLTFMPVYPAASSHHWKCRGGAPVQGLGHGVVRMMGMEEITLMMRRRRMKI